MKRTGWFYSILIANAILIPILGLRLWWAHPDVQILSSLAFIEDIDALLSGRLSDVTWFHIGSGHVFNFYRYFHYINALTFGYDSRLEVIFVLALGFSSATIAISILLRKFLQRSEILVQVVAILVACAVWYSFAGMGSRGMEFGTYIGVGMSLAVWALGDLSKIGHKVWVSLLAMQTLIVFLALGAYSLGLAAAASMSAFIELRQSRRTDTEPESRNRVWITRHSQYALVMIGSSISYVAAVKIFSTASSGLSFGSYSLIDIGKFVVNGNSGAFLTPQVLERWGNGWLLPSPFVLGSIVTGLYIVITLVLVRFKHTSTPIALGLVWYSTFVSLSVYPFRPYGDQWMLNPWYSFHHKLSLGAAVIVAVCLTAPYRWRILHQTSRLVIPLLVTAVALQSNVIMWERHPHERAWFLGKQSAALNPELLALDASGLTQLLVDMPTSIRAVEVQRKHGLSVFRDDELESIVDMVLVAGVEPDGWLLSTLTFFADPVDPCTLVVDITALAGVSDGGFATVLVVDSQQNLLRSYEIDGDDLPTRITMEIVGRVEVKFSNTIKPEEAGPDLRPLAARGQAVCWE